MCPLRYVILAVSILLLTSNVCCNKKIKRKIQKMKRRKSI